MKHVLNVGDSVTVNTPIKIKSTGRYARGPLTMQVIDVIAPGKYVGVLPKYIGTNLEEEMSYSFWDEDIIENLSENKLKISKNQLRRIIREAMDAQPEMPDVSHPLIAQFANHQFDRTPGKASWYQTMRVYEYDAGGQSPQAIVLYLTNEGTYFARINGSYENTLGQSHEDHKDPIEAIESALNSSPGPRTRLVRDRLVPVGQKIKRDPTAVGLRPYD